MDIETIQNLPPVLPEGFLRESLQGLLEHGLPQGYNTGIKDLDDICRLDKGRLVTVTGIPGSGKSEFVDFLTTTYNKKYGLKTLYYSPENSPVEFHLEKLIRKFTCKPLSELTAEERESSITYILTNFYFINCIDVTKLGDILAAAEEMVVEKQIDILVIDPYNRIDVEQAANDIETQYISRILDELTRIAVKHNLIVFLVAHPRKMEQSGRGFRIPSAYDINGSANFFNKSDFVLITHRDDRNGTSTKVRVDKVKFSHYGHLGECELEHDNISGNYYPSTVTLPFDDEYDADEDTTPQPFAFPETQHKSPLDVKVSVYPSATNTESTEVVMLKDFLLTDRYKDVAALIRQGATPDERKAIKKNSRITLPCVTPSGIFSYRDANHLKQHSGLLCIDIDYKGNEHVMEKVPTLLQTLPYVAYASKSITGDGYFAIIPLEHPSHHLAHFRAIQKEFKEHYGIVLDPSCTDVCRLRFATYDEHPYFNPKAIPYYQEYSEPIKQQHNKPKQEGAFTSTPTTSTKVVTDYDVTRSLADLDKKIEEVKQKGIVVADDYNEWRTLAMSLSTVGEDGRARFHAISSTSAKYNESECDKFYSDTSERYKDNNKYTLRTAHKIVNDAMKAHV